MVDGNPAKPEVLVQRPLQHQGIHPAVLKANASDDLVKEINGVPPLLCLDVGSDFRNVLIGEAGLHGFQVIPHQILKFPVLVRIALIKESFPCSGSFLHLPQQILWLHSKQLCQGNEVGGGGL